MAPLEVQVGEKYENLWNEIRAMGYVRVRIDGQTHSIDQPPAIDRRRKHLVEVVIDRIIVRPDARRRIADTVETALSLGKGVMHVAYPQDQVPEAKWRTEIHSQHFACDKCGRSFERLTPHSFSFNSSLGWCPACEGLGTQTGANPAGLAPRSQVNPGAGRRRSVADAPVRPCSAGCCKPSRHMATCRSTCRSINSTPSSGAPCFTAPAKTGLMCTPAASPRKTIGRCSASSSRDSTRRSKKLRGSRRPCAAKWEHLVGEVECSTCGGTRLRDDASAVRLHGRTLDELCRLPLSDLLARFEAWKLDTRERKIAGELVREVRNRLQFLVDVGLEYLTISRPAPTLSGGEAQRIRLASQVGSGLCGVLYVLDEPTIGLHPRDNRRLLGALEKLRDLGNTLLVVEHDREVVAAADQLLDFGPAAGDGGGQIVASGTPAQVARQKGSVTGPFISGKKAIPVPTNRRMSAQ